MPELQEFDIQLLDKIFSSAGLAWHKATDRSAGEQVIVKKLEGSHHTLQQEATLHNELELAGSLDAPFCLPLIGKGVVDGELMLVYSAFQARPVRQLLSQSLPVPLFLQMAVQLAEALVELHDKQIMHKRISPDSVFYDSATATVYLTDFGFASFLSSEGRATGEGLRSETSLEYISPELTGRVNRPVDHRTDLYSMGVLLYELLTGVNPFRSDDVLKTIHRQISHVPSNPSETTPTIPLMVSRIIMRLLEKNAEDRYHSASGLLEDLRRCQHDLERWGSVSEFELGKRDFSGQLRFPGNIIGRQREQEELNDFIKEHLGQRVSIVMLQGNSGMGKTLMLDEYRVRLEQQDVQCVSGRYDQLQTDVPYSALNAAVTELVELLLSGSESRFNLIKNQLAGMNSQNLSLLITVFPALAKISGPVTASSDHSFGENQNRFHEAFERLISLFCSGGQSLAVFLDDCQWMDRASLKVLDYLLESKSMEGLMLFCALGDEEEGKSAFGNQMQTAPERGIRMHPILMGPLQSTEVELFMTQVFGALTDNLRSLESILNRIANGNPLFLILYLESLHQKGLLSFNRQHTRWEVNLQEVSKAEIPDRIIDLNLHKISQLGDEALRPLQAASLIGQHFSTRELSSVLEHSQPQIMRAVWPALQTGIILPQDKNYKILNQLHEDAPALPSATFRFSNERVRQAILSVLDRSDAAGIHRRIAERLYGAVDQDINDDEVFLGAIHLREASPFFSDQEFLKTLSAATIRAGNKAYETAAYASALEFYQSAIQTTTEDRWRNEQEACFMLYLRAAESASLSGHFIEAEQLFQELFDHDLSNIQKARVYSSQVILLKTQGALDKALDAGIHGLRLLGVSFPDQISSARLGMKLLGMLLKLSFRRFDRLQNLPACTNEEMMLAGWILSEMKASAFNKSNETMGYLLLQILNLTLKYGITDSAPDAFAGFGFIQAFAFKRYRQGWRYTRLALYYGEQYEREMLKGRAYFAYSATLMNYIDSPEASLQYLEEAYRIGVESGDFINAANVSINIIQNMWSIGMPIQQVADRALTYLRFSLRIQYEDMILFHTVFLQHLYLLSGRNQSAWPEEVVPNDDDFRSRIDKSKYTLLINVYYLLDVINFILDKETAHDDSFELLEKNLFAFTGTLFHAEYLWVASLLADKRRQTGQWTTKQSLKKVRQISRQLRKLEKLNSGVFSVRRKLTDSVRLHLEGDSKAAGILIKELLEKQPRNNGALLSTMAAQWAAVVLDDSHKNAADKWAASWGLSLNNQHVPDASGRKQESSHDAKLDLASMMKATTAISGEVKLSSLLRKLMSVLVENSGAEDGFILTRNGGQWVIAEGMSARQDDQLLQMSSADSVPAAVLNYVLRTKDTFIAEDLSSMEHIIQENPEQYGRYRSVICMPITHQGEINTMLFLYNNHTRGVFSKGRIEFLKLLSGQVAISLDNALLYDNLEKKVEERTLEVRQQAEVIRNEKAKSDNLLRNILPTEVAEELKERGRATPRAFENVTVLFTDFVDFTQASEQLTAEELVQEIDHYYSAFDQIIQRYNLEKIKTIGDSYMCAGGLPVPNGDHAEQSVRAALEILEFVRSSQEEKRLKQAFNIRIGIHSGPVVAGIVGKNKFAYDIWGDTVNTASRMESSGEPGKINISGETYNRIKHIFECTYRGKISAKHKNEIDMYFVNHTKGMLKPSHIDFENVRSYLYDLLTEKLPAKLTYHNVEHIRDVEEAAIRIGSAIGISEHQLALVRTACLMHDIGFISSYEDHENNSCKQAEEILPDFGYTNEDIEEIKGMIMATRIPQTPGNLLDQIIADADLDYLGRDDYDEISETLYQEMLVQGQISNRKEWLDAQLSFLRSHQYHTDWSKKNREPFKTELIKRLETQE